MSRHGSRMRLFGLALALGLGSLIAGDRVRAQSATYGGIDPLDILDLQVKANAFVVLDTSGSMRETITAPGNNPTQIDDGELVGDDPNAKMSQAKTALKQVIQDNDAKVKFRFLRYNVDATAALSNTNRFYYVTTNSNAATMSINSTGNGSSAPGIARNTTDHTRTENGTTYYYVVAGKFWNGQTIDTSTKAETAGTATSPATVKLYNGTNTVTFTFAGAYFNKSSGGSCNGVTELVPLADCSQIDQYTGSIDKYLEPELKIDATTGAIAGYKDGASLGSNPATAPTVNGLRASGYTPIAKSLIDIKGTFNTLWDNTISGETNKPRTFVIFVTDGNDTCEPSSGTWTYQQPEPATSTWTWEGTALQENAQRAAYAAEKLYERRVSTDPMSSVTTFVIAYGSGLQADYANWVAWAGSGLKTNSTETSYTNDGKRWTSMPKESDADVQRCKAAGGCQNALQATNLDDLKKALQSAIDQGSAAGQFSASGTVAEPVWEYGADVGIDPWGDPERRYNAFTSIVFQPSFDASNFNGKFTAWGYGSPNPVQKWEAGSILANPAAGDPGVYAPTTSAPVFFHCTSSSSNCLAGTGTLSSALIKRRIYTSSSNGAFTTAATQRAVALWPPQADVAPRVDTTAGALDTAFGITGTGGAAEFAALQATYGACKGINLPPNCDASAGITNQVARARREAREIILAYTAGALPLTDANLDPLRCTGTSTAPACAATEKGNIVYQRRPWVLADSTHATPAVVSAPLGLGPKLHAAEYDELINSQWTGTTLLSAGLRNPDLVGNRADRTTVIADASLKPVMTVAYLATNGMLHAFRAGPCVDETTTGQCADGTSNTGGEELWGFVPFDQLGKLKDKRQPPKRKPHVYMLASSIRIADVFDETAPSRSGTGLGAWRVVIYFGRGAGGKSITSLDVTNPGLSTASALGDDISPPVVLWNRGNPDTVDGTSGGTKVADSVSSATGTANAAAYAKMGETWSVPAIGLVKKTDNVTTRKPAGVEYVAWVGSGYSPVSSEGSTVYALDALTGDVVGSHDVGERSSATFENAVVAPAAAMLPALYNRLSPVHPSDAPASRIYVGDIHGRVWAFPPKGGTDFAPVGGGAFADLGASQPIGNAAALLYYDDLDGVGARNHVYVEAGNDKRVTPAGDVPPFAATPPFRMYGLRDEDLTSDPASDIVDGPATLLFSVPFPNDPAPGFRGTVQPAGVFDSAGRGRVFFAGTQFTPAGLECVSSLDSVLFALTGRDGTAAYDLNASGQDEYYLIPDQVVTQLDVIRVPPESGRLNISKAVSSVDKTLPPEAVKPPPNSNVAPAARNNVYATEVRLNSAVCRQ